ncbi:MAG TPA: hypothetical protein VN381_10345, partial [Anaerovoracaceae bacterium]|nr:hypothetical protein [Anaerovoracaceae bacterium]
TLDGDKISDNLMDLFYFFYPPNPSRQIENVHFQSIAFEAILSDDGSLSNTKLTCLGEMSVDGQTPISVDFTMNIDIKKDANLTIEFPEDLNEYQEAADSNAR